MGTAALTLGIVGLFTWIFPPLGFPISGIGLILGILALLVYKQQKRRAITGIVFCFTGLVFNIGVVVGIVTAGLLFEELFHQNFGY
jgi:hypothetical protein